MTNDGWSPKGKFPTYSEFHHHSVLCPRMLTPDIPLPQDPDIKLLGLTFLLFKSPPSHPPCLNETRTMHLCLRGWCFSCWFQDAQSGKKVVENVVSKWRNSKRGVVLWATPTKAILRNGLRKGQPVIKYFWKELVVWLLIWLFWKSRRRSNIEIYIGVSTPWRNCVFETLWPRNLCFSENEWSAF